MASSLSNQVYTFTERIHKIKCKYKHDDNKCKTYEIKYKGCDRFFEYTNCKDDLMEYKCLCCKKNYQGKFDENLMKLNFLIHINF